MHAVGSDSGRDGCRKSTPSPTKSTTKHEIEFSTPNIHNPKRTVRRAPEHELTNTGHPRLTNKRACFSEHPQHKRRRGALRRRSRRTKKRPRPVSEFLIQKRATDLVIAPSNTLLHGQPSLERAQRIWPRRLGVGLQVLEVQHRL